MIIYLINQFKLDKINVVFLAHRRSSNALKFIIINIIINNIIIINE